MACVLIVDDDPQYRELLSDYLQAAGHLILSADKASEAMRLYSENDVEIVISDILMPGEDGIELLLSLNDNPKKCLIGTIMISGGGIASASTYLSIAQGLGATEIFEKPITLASLAEKIEEMVLNAKTP